MVQQPVWAPNTPSASGGGIHTALDLRYPLSPSVALQESACPVTFFPSGVIWLSCMWVYCRSGCHDTVDPYVTSMKIFTGINVIFHYMQSQKDKIWYCKASPTLGRSSHHPTQ